MEEVKKDVSRLIFNRDEQQKVIDSKRERVLQWLGAEGFSTAEIMGLVLNLSRAQTYQTLKKMERDDLVKLEKIDGLAGKGTVWTITPHGALIGSDPTAESFKVDYFEIGRVSPLTIAHHTDCQRVRLVAESAGWKDWIGEKQCRARATKEEPDKSKRLKWLKIPDGIATDPAGAVVAIELERTAKTPKRYAGILAEYMQMMKAGAIHRVVYICPNPAFTPRIARIFKDISTVKIGGQDVAVSPSVLSRFSFVTMGDWPNKKESSK